MKKLLALISLCLASLTVQAATPIQYGVIYTPSNNNIVSPTNLTFFDFNISNGLLVTNITQAIIGLRTGGVTTGVGVTNTGGVISANLAAGSNVTLTTNATTGAISIASSGGGASLPSGLKGQSVGYTADGTTGAAINQGQLFAYPYTNATRILIEGDSMSAAYKVSETNAPLGRLFANWLTGGNWIYSGNFATAGQTIDQMITDYTAQVHPFRPAGGTNSILVFWAGINNLRAGETANTTFTKWSNYLALASADAFKVLVVTANPATDLTDSKDAERTRFNDLIRTSGLYTWLYDVTRDVPKPPNTTLYFTENNEAVQTAYSIHLTATGTDRVGEGLNFTLRSGWSNTYPYGTTVSANINSGISSQFASGIGTYISPFARITYLPQVPTRLVFSGDINFVGLGSPNTIPEYMFASYLTSPNWINAGNFSQAGNTISYSYATNYLTSIQPLKPAGGTNAVLCLWLGASEALNMTFNSTAATISVYLAQLAFYINAAHTDGFFVCVATIPKAASMNSEMLFVVDEINDNIRNLTSWDYLYDAAIDLPAPPNKWYYDNQNQLLSYFGLGRAARGMAQVVESGIKSRYPTVSTISSSAVTGQAVSHRNVPVAGYSISSTVYNMLEAEDGFSGNGSFFVEGITNGVFEAYFHSSSNSFNNVSDKFMQVNSNNIVWYKSSPTGLGITNIAGVYSNNIVAGANTTITAGANGQLTIASTGGGGGGGTVGTVINIVASTAGQIAVFSDSTKTNINPSSGVTNLTLITPTIGSGTGILKTTAGAVGLAVEGTDYASPASTNTFTNKTFDAGGTGNVFKFKSYIVLASPQICDGAGAIIYTNDYTQVFYGQALFSGTAATNVNFIEYRITVPPDIDTSVDLVLKQWKIRLNGADTSASTYNIGMVSVPDSSSYTGTIANYVQVPVAADASGASGDVETASNITLTSWKSNVTAGQLWVIRMNRDGADTSTTAHYSGPLVLEYGVTQ